MFGGGGMFLCRLAPVGSFSFPTVIFVQGPRARQKARPISYICSFARVAFRGLGASTRPPPTCQTPGVNRVGAKKR
jgi:hypothetical protein